MIDRDLSVVWAVTGMGLAVLCLLVWLTFQGRRARLAHRKSHRPLADEEFLRLTGFPAEQGCVALQVRRIIASSVMGVPAATVHPDDTLEYMRGFLSEIDGVEVAFAIEEELDIRIAHKDLWDCKENLSVTDMIRRVIEESEPPPRQAPRQKEH